MAFGEGGGGNFAGTGGYGGNFGGYGGASNQSGSGGYGGTGGWGGQFGGGGFTSGLTGAGGFNQNGLGNGSMYGSPGSASYGTGWPARGMGSASPTAGQAQAPGRLPGFAPPPTTPPAPPTEQVLGWVPPGDAYQPLQPTPGSGYWGSGPGPVWGGPSVPGGFGGFNTHPSGWSGGANTMSSMSASPSTMAATSMPMSGGAQVKPMGPPMTLPPAPQPMGGNTGIVPPNMGSGFGSNSFQGQGNSGFGGLMSAINQRQAMMPRR